MIQSISHVMVYYFTKCPDAYPLKNKFTEGVRTVSSQIGDIKSRWEMVPIS